MDVRIETLPTFDLITSFALGPYPSSAPKAWDQLWAHLKQQTAITPQQMIGFGLDSPTCTPEHLLRYVAASTYNGTAEAVPEHQIYPMTIKAGKYAIYTMQGPYQNMPTYFEKLMHEWLPSTDHQLDISRPFLEIYLNNPFETEEKDYLTDLHIPLL